MPIYQASGLATKALSVYQAYIEMMNEDIRTAFDQVGSGPCSAAQLLPQEQTSKCSGLSGHDSSGCESLSRGFCWKEAYSSVCRACV